VLTYWKDQVAVSVDCFEGNLVKHGWTSLTSINAMDFIKELEQMGLQCLIFTDIKTDGMLKGPNFESLKQICDSVRVDVIASGGVSNIEDIKKLCAMDSPNLVGAITGKAIYEGTLNLSEAIAVCEGSSR
jgi:phosphoribosylformimino-5-aminoimidazole carboxamide ribotide isomerase